MYTSTPGQNCTSLILILIKDVLLIDSCVGQGYSCQLSDPSSSCIRTSECVGDGTCRPIMRSSGTICRPAVDVCDQPERWEMIVNIYRQFDLDFIVTVMNC